MSERDFVGIARHYASEVTAGKIPACTWVVLAAQRYLDDFDRTDFEFTLNVEKATRICKFIELLPHVKGKWARARETISLESWQIFILVNLFGWVDANGLRRFRTAYIEVPRKNAKSTLVAGIGLYCLAADDEEGAEVYSAATTRDQARIVWQAAKRMADKSPGYCRRFGVSTGAHAIYVPDSESTFKPLSRDQGGNQDGLNVTAGIIDELHAHKTRDLFDVLETATGSRDQPLLLCITTAGSNRAGICYEQRTYVTELLNSVAQCHAELVDDDIKGGTANDDSYFGIIYTIDDADRDRWDEPAVWRKANPNYGVSVSPEDLERKALKARRRPAAQNNFLVKHLDVWVGAHSAWMNMLAWNRQGRDNISLEDFHGCRCWVAGDLASKVDIAALAFLIEDADDLILITRNYVNDAAVEDSDNSQYQAWADAGHLIVTDGNVIDYRVIEDDLLHYADILAIQDIALDPWQAQYIAQRLTEKGLKCVEYRQTVQNMSEPMKELEAGIISGKLWHDGNLALSWMASNVVAHTDAKDNIYPRKETGAKKIDGIVAAIMAQGRRLQYEDTAMQYFGV